MDDRILLPVITLVALTAIMWVLMYIRRISEVRHMGIGPQSLANSGAISVTLKNVTVADNFRNLLETPLLFYVICVLLIVTDRVTDTQLFLAWCFVVFRILHSMIHVTYNKVVHRWLVCVASTVCLFIMWGLFSLAVFRATLS